MRIIMVSVLLVFCLIEKTVAQDLCETIHKAMSDDKMPGAIVAFVDHERVLFLESFGYADVAAGQALQTDAIMPIGSVSKVFAATLVSEMIDSELLRWDDTVAECLGDSVKTPPWATKVSIRHLVTHTSGLPREATNRRNLVDSPSVMLPYSTRDLYDFMAVARLESSPGKKWSYSNIGYGLLGHLVEKTSGVSYEKLLAQRVLQKLGLNDTGLMPSDEQKARIPSGYWHGDEKAIPRPRWENGEIAAFAGMFSSAKDLSGFLMINLEAARNPNLNREWSSRFQSMHRPLVIVSEKPNRKMATGWFVDSVGGITVLGHGGEVDSFSCCIAIVPDLDLGMVVMVNQGDKSAEKLCQTIFPKAIKRFGVPATPTK